MKKLLLTLGFISILFFTGCDEKDHLFSPDYTPPAVPRNVMVLTGDQYAEVSWISNRENDLDGYNVYVSDSYKGKYTLIATTRSTYFNDNYIRNGRRYYYAITAFDYDGNESGLSYENVYAAPRPEGFNVSLTDFNVSPNNAGYDFSNYSVVNYLSTSCDFYFEIYQGKYYLVVSTDTDIQDMGSTRDIYDITYAPETGWSSTKDALVRTGHTYVIWTWDNHYAKVRVRSITQDRVVFDWAYQLIEGEPVMKPGSKNGTRTAEAAVHSR
ncbi:MAG: hypothetical protein HYV28_09600 [Ignavibacteriales bacterium]|nr:hypothetical protein [Ignavibacteriales bacterium]